MKLYSTRAGRAIVGGWKFHTRMMHARFSLGVRTEIMSKCVPMKCQTVGGALISV
jgi:hypothetical protein